jgi:hypothetical protein
MKLVGFNWMIFDQRPAAISMVVYGHKELEIKIHFNSLCCQKEMQLKKESSNQFDGHLDSINDE